jgi:predicted ester cyclase
MRPDPAHVAGIRPGPASLTQPARRTGEKAPGRLGRVWPPRPRRRTLVAVTEVLERLRLLWTQPVDARGDAAAAFRAVYADPVVVNGAQLPVTALVERARSLQRAFDRLDMHILDTVQTPDRIVIAFLVRGRQIGPFASPLGAVAPTHRDIEVRIIDILTITGGKISALWVVSDDLGLLRQFGAVKLA